LRLRRVERLRLRLAVLLGTQLFGGGVQLGGGHAKDVLVVDRGASRGRNGLARGVLLDGLARGLQLLVQKPELVRLVPRHAV
jgi:hypothetical protein